MAKTIQLIFVRGSGVGLLLEGKKLESYEKDRDRALEAYKRVNKIIDSHGGKMIKCSFKPINAKEATTEELSAPFEQIIMVKDNTTCVQLKGEAFTCYQRQYREGLVLLKLTPKISGTLVKIQT
ncbi:MAG: hypothetical protein NTX82_07310 [Candidatus Parcubacteria bacterium]|nr:hypothetical protein [Candidatus Parcubacteria bacterium]